MAVIKSFRDLNVYAKGLAASRDIFDLTKGFPVEERYALTSQMRRSSRAVTAMIAEAWARRRCVAAFVSKIDEALGEASETQAWLDHALACEYVGKAAHRRLDEDWQRVGGMLNRIMQRADAFCGKAR